MPLSVTWTELDEFEIWSEAEWQAQIEKDMALGATDSFALSEELKTLSL